MLAPNVLRAAILVLVCFCTFEAQAPSNRFNRQSGVSHSKQWDCKFSENACHFRNQYNLARFSRYHNPGKRHNGVGSMLVLDLSSQFVRKFPGARLISHYFPARRPEACLGITYLMEGNSPRAFYVIQQDKENKCIFADENDRKTDQWRNVTLTLDLTEGDPRFFIEAQYENNRHNEPNPNPGYIAISAFSFSFGPCQVRNDVNNCFADMPAERPSGVPPPPAE